MKRGDACFATVGNKFCWSEHFLPTDIKLSLTGHRRLLKPGAVPSVFNFLGQKSTTNLCVERKGYRRDVRHLSQPKQNKAPIRIKSSRTKLGIVQTNKIIPSFIAHRHLRSG